MPDASFVGFKAGGLMLRRLDELAAARGGNRSAAIRAAILEATDGPDRPVADHNEVLGLLSDAARSGSVPAMRELLAYLRERREPAAFDPLRDLDELAARRTDCSIPNQEVPRWPGA